MSQSEEKIKSLAAQNLPSNWREKVAFRKENKAWLKKSIQISLRILDALDDKGWNQTDLANALGVSRQQVSKLVKGDNDFKLSTIAKLEEILGIELLVILAANE